MLISPNHYIPIFCFSQFFLISLQKKIDKVKKMERKEKKITYNGLCDLFVKFLNKHNVRKEYLTNAKCYNLTDGNGEVLADNNPNSLLFLMNPLLTPRIRRHTQATNGIGIINVSFHWESTPQGHRFWSELDREWNNMIYKRNIKLVLYKEKAKKYGKKRK